MKLGLTIVAAMAMAVLIGGCAGSPAAIQMASAEQLQSEELGTLIYVYGYLDGSEKIENELRRRGVFSDDEWARIKSNRIQIGDRPDVVRASWGRPRRVNTFTSHIGRDEQWVYGHHKIKYVYFSNDHVSSIDVLDW